MRGSPWPIKARFQFAVGLLKNIAETHRRAAEKSPPGHWRDADLRVVAAWEQAAELVEMAYQGKSTFDRKDT